VYEGQLSGQDGSIRGLDEKHGLPRKQIADFQKAKERGTPPALRHFQIADFRIPFFGHLAYFFFNVTG